MKVLSLGPCYMLKSVESIDRDGKHVPGIKKALEGLRDYNKEIGFCIGASVGTGVAAVAMRNLLVQVLGPTLLRVTRA